MVQKTMKMVAAKHNEWLNIVLSFGCKPEIAEDIVQEMYIKIQLKLEKGLDIMYNEKEINYYYIFKTLKSLFYDLKRKGKNITIVSIDDVHLTTSDINYEEPYKKIENELLKMFWYDRKVFEIINEGESIAEFSRKSKIHYYSLYNTYTRVKNKLKKLL
jgi:DNA-directed RNA polymerase specialized sigma24 family protein